MLSKHFKYIFLSLLVLIAPALASCVDDLLMDDQPIGPGQSNVSMTVSFFPNVTNNLGGSRAAGNSIETIKSLQVVVFNEDGSLAKLYNESELIGLKKNLSHTDQPGMSSEDSINGGSWTEGKQAMATFNLAGLPYGKYKFYAVANHTVKETQLFSDDDMTAEKRLLNMSVDWQLSSVGKNAQMFGYFTAGDDKITDKPLAGLNAEPIRIDRANISLHAWIKRLASKVTVAFDGSGLHKNVNIFIHKVTIKDIPKSCYLGVNNQPKSELANRSDVLHLDGETIYFDNNGVAASNPGDGEANHTKWLTINDGTAVLGSDHSATAPALFFYENMQGDYKDDERYNKEPKAGWVHEYLNRPDADWEKRPWDYDTKDKIATGTYVEVEGFYQSTNDLNTTSGPIKYRFMLGKNTTYNYNAQRNHHYKLTLKFKGWANQPEWHIEYVEEKPALYVPEPYYMPYLYNQRVDMPIRYIGDIDSLKVEIIENDWAPYDKALKAFPGPGTNPPDNTPSNDFLWNKNAWETYNGIKPGSEDSEEQAPHPYLGFLALSMVKNNPTNIIPDLTYNDTTEALDSLKNYYFQTQHNIKCSDGVFRDRRPQHIRIFNAEQLQPRKNQPGVEFDQLEDNYLVSEEAGSRTLMLPLFSRAKTMILNSGYSGNNPYEYFHRRAKIRVTGYFANGTVITRYSNILQVPRITNPKAIWRKKGSLESFDVTLMTRASAAYNADFVPFVSEGSWSAEIEKGDASNFTLIPGPHSKLVNGRVEGGSTEINFKIGFKGNNACAVVLVMYNGEKCVHRIFLRQGYGALQVNSGGATWYSYNLYHGGDGGIGDSSSSGAKRVDSPIAFGSYFKRKNLNQGICESNNDTLPHLKNINPDSNVPTLSLSNGGRATWRSIGSKWLSDYSSYGQNTGDSKCSIEWQTVKIGSTSYQLPTFKDFEHLTNHSEYGFGIAYGDGASTTKTDFYEATGYDGKDSSYGMRGVVVYDKETANQIFFPMSKSGHGRRNVAYKRNSARTQCGRLLYGDVPGQLVNKPDNNNIYRPIPYNLGNSPGAVYWIRKLQPGGHVEGKKSYSCAAWDMNYFNFDFGPYTANCLYKASNISNEATGSDALPIRLVTKSLGY